MDLTNA